MTIWVLVADSARARVLAGDPTDTVLEEIETLVHPESRRYAGDITTDRPGRAFDSAGEGRHAMGQSVGPGEQEAVRFAREISARLEEARGRGELDRLYLVAAPRFLGHLRSALDEPTRRLVAGEVDKNLTGHGIADVRSHLPARL